MITELTIDISNKPELLRLAEEVARTRRPRKLKRADETIAVVMPVVEESEATYNKSLATLGSWGDLDASTLISHIYRAREAGNRPSTRP